jgi:hypothetical protein
MDGDQIKEAGWAAQFTVGLSAYLYGIGYNHEQFNQEVEATIEHLKQSAQE